MIKKMKFLSITGPKDDIDRVANTYLSNYEIHLENALSELSNVKGLRPFTDSNPYNKYQSKCTDILKYIPNDIASSTKEMSFDEAEDIIINMHNYVHDYQTQKTELLDKKKELSNLIHKIEPFKLLTLDISEINNFNYIKFRYGRLKHEHFNKFTKYQYPDLEVIFYETDRDDTYVWGLYFVPYAYADKVDAIFASLQFQIINLPNTYSGDIEQTYTDYTTELNLVKQQHRSLEKKFNQQMKDNTADFLLAKKILLDNNSNNEIRKYAACTSEVSILQDEKHETFYFLCGWMSDDDATRFLNAIEDDPNVFCISEDTPSSQTKPPTKLKNPSIFKPFETFISMYGLPSHNEIDPTIFLALSYSILFGMMFGDVGQGALLFIFGLLIYKFKKVSLCAIISLCGFFSTIFGFLYGSVFGFEGKFIHPIWISPMENVMTILFTAIGFGIFLNMSAMVMNIINGIKSGNKGRIFFDTNGIAGLIFYILVVACVVMFFLGYELPATSILIFCFGMPLLCIFLREPLGHLLEKKNKLIEGSKGMFFVEAFFELFEILLSFMTNSLSFVRVGAFALSHAGMMGVVLMLSNAEGALSSMSIGNIVVLIIGNLFVMGLEGLSVGIQVLRLEYYEMFSRFYGGTGRQFIPYKSTSKN